MSLFDEITNKNTNQIKKRDDEELKSSMSLFDEITSGQNTNNSSLDTQSMFDTSEKKKTVGNTVGYTTSKAATGFAGVWEGIADTGAWALKQIGKLTSWMVDNPVGAFIFGEEAGDYENNTFYQIGEAMTQDDIVKQIDEKIDTSVMAQQSYVEPGSLGANIATGVGQVAGLVVSGKMFPAGKTSTVAKTASKGEKILNSAKISLGNPTTKSMFVSTFGNSYTQASNSGATELDATVFGVLNATKEVGTEMMYGGLGAAFGKGALDDVVTDKVTSLIKNKVLQKITKLGIGMAAEGVEEVASTLLQPFVDYVYTNKLDYTAYDSLLDDFITGALVSGILQTGSNVVNLKGKKAEEVVNKLQEKNVIDKLTTISKDTEQIINNKQIKNETKIDRINNQIDILNDVLTENVRFDKNRVEMLYAEITKLKEKRKEITNTMSEEEKIKTVNKLEKEITAIESSLEEDNSADLERQTNDDLSDSTKKEATSIDIIKEDKKQQIDIITKEVDKDKVIKVLSNKKYVDDNKKALINTAQVIIDTINETDSNYKINKLEIVAELTKEQLQIEDIGKLFKKQVVFTKGLQSSGMMIPKNSQLIFIDINAKNDLVKTKNTNGTMLYVLGHEMFHALQTAEPEVYNQFVEYIKQDINLEQIINFMQKYDSNDSQGLLEQLKIDGKFDLEMIKNNPDKYTTQNKALNDISEEIIANEFGRIFTDKEYLNNLKTKNPTLFKKVVDAIKKFFKSLEGSVFESSLTQLQVENIRQQFENNITGLETMAQETTSAIKETKEVKSVVKEEIKQEVKEKVPKKKEIQELKEKQFKILQNHNPMADDYHVGIRKVEDIKTFEEVIKTADEDEEFVWGDYSLKDAKRDLESGFITVYSSHDIKQGTFVSTSKNQAEDYAGGKSVKSQKVPLEDVAWINGDEGQYAKVKEKLPKKKQVIEKEIVKKPLVKKDVDEYYGDLTKEPTKEELLNVEKTPEIVDETLKITKLSLENRLDSIKETLTSYQKEKSAERKTALKSTVIKMYNNYKKDGGTEVIAEIEDFKKEDFKSTLLTKLNSKSLPKQDDVPTKRDIKYLPKQVDVPTERDIKYANNMWKGTDSYLVNEMLRNDSDVEHLPENINGKDYKKFSKVLDVLLKRAPKIKGTFNRSLDIKGEKLQKFLSEWKEGTTITVPQYMSAAKTGIYDDTHNIHVIITTTGAKDVSNLMREAEVEIMFDRNKNIKIESVDATNLNDIKIIATDVSNKDNVKYLPKQDEYAGQIKESKFYSNTAKSSDLFKNILQEAENNPNLRNYITTSNDESIQKAVELIKTKTDTVSNFFMNDVTNPVDVATGAILMQYYNSIDDRNSEIAIYKKLKSAATPVAQTLQAYNILKNISSDAMVEAIRQELDNANEELQESKDLTIKQWLKEHTKGIELSESESEYLYQMSEKSKKYEADSQEYITTMALINKFVADKIPKQLATKIKAFRRIAMLFNPKTMLRNFTGNVVMKPLYASTDFFGTIVDKQLSKKYKTDRTMANRNFSALRKGSKQGNIDALQDAKLGIMTSKGNPNEVQQGNTFNQATRIGRVMNWTEEQTNKFLNLGDRMFEEAEYENALQNLMITNNVTTPTETMKQIATEISLKRTYKNSGKLATTALQVRQLMNRIGISNGKIGVFDKDVKVDFGMGDIILPFVMTPANLLVATYDFSPLAVLSVYKNAKTFKEAVAKGQNVMKTQRALVDSIGKATTGTILMFVAYALARAGIITGGEDEDKDIKALNRAMGYQPYSIKVGDMTFTYDWLQPISNIFATMGEVVRQNKDEKQTNMFKVISESFLVGSDRLFEQSFLQGIKTLFGGGTLAEGVSDTLVGVPNSFIPSLLKNFSDFLDGNVKATYDSDNPLNTMLYSMANKIPGLKSILPTKTDVLGKPVRKHNNILENVFTSFLSPMNMSKDTTNGLGDEITDIYNHTGVKSIMPQVSSNYIDYDINGDGTKERIRFNNYQMADLQTNMGKIVSSAFEELFVSDVYINASYDDKAAALTSLMEYAKAKAIRDSGLVNNYEIKGGNAAQINNYMNKGLNVSNAIMYDSIINKIKSLENENGETIKGSEKGQKAYEIMNMQIDSTSKDIMLELISNASKNPETTDTLSVLGSKQQYIDYYSLSRDEKFNISLFSRDGYDTATTKFKMQGTQYIEYIRDISDLKEDYLGDEKKSKIVSYINSLPLSTYQKVYLYSLSGYSIKAYQQQMFDYINKMGISKDEKYAIWKELGFK